MRDTLATSDRNGATMPFTDTDGMPLRRVRLQQLLDEDGLEGRLFQLMEPFQYREGETVTTVAAHELDLPARNSNGAVINGTDITSVPTIFWSLIAPHGRQSPAAILHDQRVAAADALPASERVAARRPIDLEFQRALRDRGVPRLRARLMWAFVSLQSTFEPAPRSAVAIIVGSVVATLLAWAAVPLTVSVSPWFLLLLAAPVAAVLAGWRIRRLMLTLVLAGVFLGPLMLAQAAVVGLFRLVELVASIWDDRGGSIVTPTLRR